MTTGTDTLVWIERAYDALPRVAGARVEPVGPFELFLPDGPTWPFYARPRLGTSTFTRAHVDAVRARQRELGVPEAVEWVDDVTPSLLPQVRASGLTCALAPLMVLDPVRLPDPASVADAQLRALDPDAADFADLYQVSTAVAELGFRAAGTAPGPDGPVQRDTILAEEAPHAPHSPATQARLHRTAARIRAGLVGEAVAFTAADGVLARGAYQGTGAPLRAAEVVGVATLPAARRRGLGAAVSAFVAWLALQAGYQLVFLGAANEDVARVYARIGFVRVGTAVIAEA